MRHRILTMISLALVVGGSVGAAIPALAAVGQSSSPPSSAITILSPGKLLAHGAAANVSVTIMCLPGDSAFTTLQLTEKSGHIVVSAPESANFTCTGGPQTNTITVVAPAGGRPFAVGSAFVQASLEDCTPFFTCTFENATATIQLKN